jgi:Ca2+-dependent lipid-binding protein
MLGPIMYSPNVLTLDMEKFFAGDFDLSRFIAYFLS